MTEETIYENVRQPLLYEGASTNYRNEQRGLVGSEFDIDSLAAREILLLQMRSAHAVRNNGNAEAARGKSIAAMGVIKVNWKGKDGKTHQEAQDLWDEFASNPALDGYGTFGTLQGLWNSSSFTSGAAFIRYVISRTEQNVPLKLQTIPTSLHDILYNGDDKVNSKNIRNGIRFKDNKPFKYYFRKGIYNDVWYGVENPFKHTVIDANDLVHLFERHVPNQWIGVPKLAPVLLPLYELDELIDATVAKQKAAQAIAWIIENSNPMAMTPTGTPIQTEDNKGKTKIAFKATGGNTQYLNKGEKINFYQSTDIGPNLGVLIEERQRTIASSLKIPYFMFTGDTNKLNFSSIRALLIELRTYMEFIHHTQTIPLCVGKIANRFKEIASLTNPAVRDAVPSYRLPRWYGVDSLKDSQANFLDLGTAGTTVQRVMDERDISVSELEESMDLLERLGIKDKILGTKQGNQETNTAPNSNSAE